VLPKDAPELRKLLPAWVETLENAVPDSPQFASVQLAARAAVGSGCAGAFLLPVDVPAPQISVWRALESSLGNNTEVAQPTFQGRGGHPVLLSRGFLEKLVALPESSRLDEAIHSAVLVRVQVSDPAIHANWNTPADLKSV
jgi:CTP:molybdopterin cytidylyltransferase MocA